mmetsp:Transcript_30671/g.74310  ORF Transcript_30671/g.74310 Transcript_30671/m.74310 type:complete len:102 (+) Transcript_30671:1951-2256(+)
MAGLLSAFVESWLIVMIVRFIQNKNRSVERYADIQLKKMCKETYPATMAQMKADVDKLATHTNLPALAGKGENGGTSPGKPVKPSAHDTEDAAVEDDEEEA